MQWASRKQAKGLYFRRIVKIKMINLVANGNFWTVYFSTFPLPHKSFLPMPIPVGMCVFIPTVRDIQLESHSRGESNSYAHLYTGVHESIYQRQRLDGDWEQRKSSSPSSSSVAAAEICLRPSIVRTTTHHWQDKSISTSVRHLNYFNDHDRGLVQTDWLKQCIGLTDDYVWSRAGLHLITHRTMHRVISDP